MNPANEKWLYDNRKDLWSMIAALKYSGHKKEIWDLLSDEDKDILKRAEAS